MCRHVHASLHQSIDDITINNGDSSSMTSGRGLVLIKRGRVAPTHKYDTEQHMDPLSTAATKYRSSQIKDKKTWYHYVTHTFFGENHAYYCAVGSLQFAISGGITTQQEVNQ